MVTVQLMMCSPPRHGLPTCPEPKNKQVSDYSVLHTTSPADDQSVRGILPTQQMTLYWNHRTHCTQWDNAHFAWMPATGDLCYIETT